MIDRKIHIAYIIMFIIAFPTITQNQGTVQLNFTVIYVASMFFYGKGYETFVLTFSFIYQETGNFVAWKDYLFLNKHFSRNLPETFIMHFLTILLIIVSCMLSLSLDIL